MDKRGQGLSTNAIILIVLGVFVLAILILGFTLGWNKLAPWIKTDNNVATIVSSCDVACSTNSKFDFCSVKRDLNDGEGVKLKDVTCNYLAAEQTRYGISSCAAVTCDVILSEKDSEEEAKESCKEKKENDIVQYLKENVLVEYKCKAEDVVLGSGQ